MNRNGLYLCLSLVVFVPNLLFAGSWSFPGLSITTREQWGADESWRYFSTQGYNNRVARNQAYQDRLDGNGDDPTGSFEKRRATEQINSAREAFLIKNYPNEMVVDTTIREVKGKYLLWGLGYHYNKKKIVIHHTVTRQTTTPEDAQASIQEIYKQHTVTQGRGDIGYNFLIDPLGTIYEGRAGGQDVIGAHADRNNTSTVGVSLLGNYDLHKPTPAMWLSLKKLLLGVMLEYGIDPFDKQNYFTPINQEPWLQVHTDASIVGHGDTKNTACPGEYVEDRLPELRKDMDALMSTLQDWKKASLSQFRFLTKKFPIWIGNEDRVVVKYPLPNRVIRDCKLFGDGIALKQCGGDGKYLTMTVTRETTTPSGQYILLVDTDAGAVWIDVVVVRDQQLDTLLQERQDAHPLTTPPTQAIEKIDKHISMSDVQWIRTRPVGVLLYEPTTTMQERKMQCEGGCAVSMDTERLATAYHIQVAPSSTSGLLQITVDNKTFTSKAIRLFNPRSVITFTDRKRGSEQTPLNYFRGDISIQREGYTTVDKQQKIGRTVVNHISLDDYFRGVAETIETQHMEKLRAMALLVKGYTYFYIGGHRHPSIPEGATYQAIDDPRLFQKYVGAGKEQTSPNWQNALRYTKDQVVMYEAYLPILPYFHCSAGFIRSGEERFGWTDTPWLINKLDVAVCESGEFEGHGVGLSGDGAEKLAQAGANFKQILQYYYPGVRLMTIPAP